jgi:hypothetical protein
MLDAHEALCEASPENVLRFKDVVDFLRQELHSTTDSKYAVLESCGRKGPPGYITSPIVALWVVE